MSVFSISDLSQPTLLQKLLRREPPINAIIELKNALAVNNVQDVTLEDIYAIADNYNVNIYKKYKKELLDLYGQYLLHSLKDSKLSEEEIDDLKHLKYLFDLKDRDIKSLHDQATGNIYHYLVQEVIEDRRLDEDEKKRLKELKQNLQLDDALAGKLYRESATSLIYQFIYDAISDERLSPDEESELDEIMRSLNVEVKLDLKTRELLEKYKLFWQVENDELPVIHAGIYLHKNEKCHFQSTVKWMAPKRKLTPAMLGRTKILLKIRKGLYWRNYPTSNFMMENDLLRTRDIGDLLITNMRVIFVGLNENKSIKLDQILDFNVFRNGIEIQRDNGSGFFFECTKNTDLFGIILGRAIKDAL